MIASGWCCPSCQDDSGADVLDHTPSGVPTVLKCRLCGCMFADQGVR